MLFHRRAALLCALALPFSSGLAGVVTDHGMLQASGNQILDKNGAPFQVAGMSLFWSIWGGQNFFNQNAIDTISAKWKATVVRVPAAIEHHATAKDTADQGYIQNPTRITTIVKRAVDAAIKDDIYVIVDFHADSAFKEITQSKAFFADMAQTYGSKPNVIFEIWNEPDSGVSVKGTMTTWNDVKTYADSIIPVIRQYSSNLIVVGTPYWSQNVDSAAKAPLTDPNVAYTLHFYACSHGRALLNRANNALASGIPIFITEFGLSPDDGGQASNKDSIICTDSAAMWLDWADSNKVSWANWSLSNADQSSAALTMAASYNGNWPDAVVSPSGMWIRSRLQARAAAATSIGPVHPTLLRPAIRFSVGDMEVQLPAGTSRAELFDLSGRTLCTSSSDRMSLSHRVSGVDWVRWIDGTGLHSTSIVLP
jgi:endoglucanase